jgi:hypothetical protein
MTISTTIVKNSYSGNGATTVFNYNFKILSSSDLKVIIRSSTGTETTKTLNTHYTLTGVGSAGGGSITFTAGNIPTSGQTIVLIRDTTQTQSIDYVANDPFPAETHEEGLDKGIILAQELQEEVDRCIKLSRTNAMTSTEFTVGAADRANKILAFDANGEIAVTQELGTYRGNWSTATSYAGRDLVKDTSNNNIYYVNTAHTSSGSQPLSSNANNSYYTLIVDAASAASSATASAASAAAASTSATNAANSATSASGYLATVATSATNAANSATASASSASTASTQATNAANSATSASTSASTATTQATNSANSATSASGSASTATTQASNASTSATNAASSASAASTSASNANTSATNAASSASAASSSASAASASASSASGYATAAQAAQAAAELAADNFDDTYLGAKSSAPSVDNDGGALSAGDLYFNTSSNTLQVYNGSAWQTAAISASGFATLAGTETLTNKTISGSSNTLTNINATSVGTGAVDNTEFGYLDGVTSNIQTQLTSKPSAGFVIAMSIAL